MIYNSRFTHFVEIALKTIALLLLFTISAFAEEKKSTQTSRFAQPRKVTDAEKEIFAKSLEDIKLLTTPELKAAWGLKLMEAQLLAGDEEGMRDTSDYLLGCSRELKNVFAKDELLGKMAYIHNQMGDFSKAVDLVRSISGDLKIRASILFGIIKQRIGNDYPTKNIAIAKDDPKTELPGKAMNMSSKELVLLMKKIIDDAIREKEHAVQYAAYLLLAHHLTSAGETLQGTEMFQNALHSAKELEKIEAIKAVGEIMGSFARTLLETGAETSVLDCYEKFESPEMKNEALLNLVYNGLTYENLSFVNRYIGKIENEEYRLNVAPFYIALLSRNENAGTVAAETEILAGGKPENVTKITFMAAAVLTLHGELDQALKIADQFEESKELALTRNDLLLKIIDRAVLAKDFDTALKAAEKISVTEQRTVVLRRIAVILLQEGEKERATEVLESSFSEEDRTGIAFLETERETLDPTMDAEQRLAEAGGLFARELQYGNIFGAQKTLRLMGEAAAQMSDPMRKIDTLLTVADGLTRLGVKDEAVKLLQKHENDFTETLRESQLRYHLSLLVMENDPPVRERIAVTSEKILTLLKSVENPGAQELQILALVLGYEARVQEIKPEAASLQLATRWIELATLPEQKLAMRLHLAGTFNAAERAKVKQPFSR